MVVASGGGRLVGSMELLSRARVVVKGWVVCERGVQWGWGLICGGGDWGGHVRVGDFCGVRIEWGLGGSCGAAAGG